MRIAFIAGVACICTAVLVGFRHRPDVEYVVGGTDPDLAPTTRPAASIYLEPYADTQKRWLVNSGGVVRELSDGVQGEPSRLLHRGKRWFLTIRELPAESYPDGSPRREVFWLNEDGRAVQLTNQPDLEPGPFTVRWPRHGQDRQISWIGRRRSTDEQILEGGVYTARLSFNERGEPAGLVSQPQSPVLPLALVQDSGLPRWTTLPVPDACGHDWSPDGRQIVIESVRQELRVADLPAGQPRVLVAEPGCDPVWSPDGSVIAFKQMLPFGAIVTVRPDGGGEIRVQPASQGDYVVCRPVFAPNGDRLAHTRVHWLTNPARSGAADCIAAWITDLNGGPEDRVLQTPRGYYPVAWCEDAEECDDGGE